MIKTAFDVQDYVKAVGYLDLPLTDRIAQLRTDAINDYKKRDKEITNLLWDEKIDDPTGYLWQAQNETELALYIIAINDYETEVKNQ